MEVIISRMAFLSHYSQLSKNVLPLFWIILNGLEFFVFGAYSNMSTFIY